MTLLLLGGTAEARQIGAGLAGADAIMSLAGVTRDAAEQPLPVRIGGFGGAEGFASYLDAAKIHAVLDATHPFADRISARTARICKAKGLPYLQFLRAPWRPGPGDRWTNIAKAADAADHIAPGATVFLGTGRQNLTQFANLDRCRVICRQIDPPDAPFPFAGGQYLIGRPPFAVADEIALFRAWTVDVLVVKNAGGVASATKLMAARALGIPVLMIARPDMGDWPIVDRVDAALDWALGQARVK